MSDRGALLVVVGLGAVACGPPATATSPSSASSVSRAELSSASSRGADRALARVVETLSREVTTRSPGTELGLAVYDLATREYAGTDDEVPHVSASSTKAIWVAAALQRAGVAAVAPYAAPIFEESSNDAAARVVDLAGPESLNAFYASVGMKRSGFTQWFGRSAPDSPRLVGDDNYVTARDAIAFLVALHEGDQLDAASVATLRRWMTWTPRSGFGGWLGTLLPPETRATLEHKAGWLPPPYEERCVNEIGIVHVDAGRTSYAIAILARRGADYEAEQAFVEHASCAVFRAVARRDDLECR